MHTAARLHRERPSQPPTAGIVLGISHAQAHRLLPAVAATTASSSEEWLRRRGRRRPLTSSSSASLAWLNRTAAAQGAQALWSRWATDAIVEAKTDDDAATTMLRPRSGTGGLAEKIGAPVCLWGAADAARARGAGSEKGADRSALGAVGTVL